MKTATRILTALYCFAGLTYILLGDGTPIIAGHVLKGCLIPLLIIIFIINLNHKLKGLNLLILTGLIFSWAGDVAIDFSFVPGLACFMMAQIVYLTAFFLTPGRSVIFRERSYLLIFLLIAGSALIYFMYDDLGEMKLPVIVYAAVILTMLAAALDRIRKVNRLSYYLVLAGALLFVFSDSCIAINKFTWDFDFSGPIIMSTYLAAQYLIMTGYIKGTIEK
jgi:uncharacterized membrane protein YhhN